MDFSESPKHQNNEKLNQNGRRSVGFLIGNKNFNDLIVNLLRRVFFMIFCFFSLLFSSLLLQSRKLNRRNRCTRILGLCSPCFSRPIVTTRLFHVDTPTNKNRNVFMAFGLHEFWIFVIWNRSISFRLEICRIFRSTVLLQARSVVIRITITITTTTECRNWREKFLSFFG